MGLLDQAKEKYGLLMQYIEANTPRSTRPVAKPGKVFDEGLINPNEYTRPQADRFKDSAFGLLGVVPGVGDAASAAESADLFNRGEKFAGSLAALGALPLVPSIGGMFIGKGAKTWDALKAQQAEEMLAKGVDPREVWKQTGTMRGVDKALRQEIPDNAARAKPMDEWTWGNRETVKSGDSTTSAAGEFLQHDALQSAYPDGMLDFGDANRRLTMTVKPSMSGGSYDNEYNIALGMDGNAINKSTGLHELQHAIQQREGWARGGSPETVFNFGNGAKAKDEQFAFAKQAYEESHQTSGDPLLAELFSDVKPWDSLSDREKLGWLDQGRNVAYRRLAGEAEARLTQSRMGLDAAQRLEHYPYDAGPYGFDVPADQQIVRGLLDGPAMSYADEAAKKTKAKK